MINRNTILVNSRLPILLHILAWVIIMIIPRYVIYTYGEENRGFLNHHYINLAIYGSLFYLNYLLLVPKLFLNGRKISYFLSALALIVMICIGMWYFEEHSLFGRERAENFIKMMEEINKNPEILKPPPPLPLKQFKIVNYLYTSILILGFSLGLRLLEKVSQNEKEKKELEKEKLNSELAFLKNQISPHFFFNTLNNIYSLIGINTENAQDAVLKLSKLMRYLLYESEKGESRLHEEIAFLAHYIDLMKLRLNNKVALTVSLPDKYPDYTIPPLLFVPFIENAFKHGVSYRESSFIDIKMSLTENRILFSTKNNNRKNSKADDGNSGIGLENVKKRLTLLYPGKHHLTITENEDVFFVELILEIKSGNEENKNHSN